MEEIATQLGELAKQEYVLLRKNVSVEKLKTVKVSSMGKSLVSYSCQLFKIFQGEMCQ